MIEATTERDRAINAATRILDMPHVDPDGTRCVLARQFLREVERRDALQKQVNELQGAFHAFARCPSAPTHCNCRAHKFLLDYLEREIASLIGEK